MKYFTRDFICSSLSDEESEQIRTSYHQHIELLLPNLPESIAELTEKINLHDGLICRVIVDQKTGKLTMELRCGDLQVGYFDLELAYSGVKFSALDLVALAALVRDRRTEILSDELDIDKDNTYIHRILFYPIGEISIHFESINLNQESKPDRNIPFVGDPYVCVAG